MSQQGAALQTYNTELVKHVEGMVRKRDELMVEIAAELKEKNQLEKELKCIQEKINTISARIADKMAVKSQYDRVLSDAESAYMKILESSQLLLSVLKKESVTLDHKEVTKNGLEPGKSNQTSPLPSKFKPKT